jgi:hypothetical protein
VEKRKTITIHIVRGMIKFVTFYFWNWIINISLNWIWKDRKETTFKARRWLKEKLRMDKKKKKKRNVNVRMVKACTVERERFVKPIQDLINYVGV